MEQSQWRHEYKHTVNRGDCLHLQQRLSVFLRRDPHGGDSGVYSVRSLYFDNENDKALREKVTGVSDREKFRLRCYNGDPSFLRLEKKVKSKGLCSKSTAVLSRRECERILEGDYAFLREHERDVCREFYAKLTAQRLRPKAVVDYDRRAFLYDPGNVRVTIDSNIRTALYATDFLNPSLATLPALDPREAIVEVKYDAFLPDLIRDLVQMPNRKTASYSKYAAARVL